MRRSGFDSLPFNVVAYAEPGFAAEVMRALDDLGRFRPTPYRAVLIGMVEGDPGARLLDHIAASPEHYRRVTRIIPLDAVVDFERDDVTEALCVALDGEGSRIAGETFHVRARLRGLKGRVESQAVERALGGFLLDLAERAGAAARVVFTDPDVVVAIEVVGRRVGYGFLDRRLRAAAPIRPR